MTTKQTVLLYLVIYIIGINLVSFLLMRIDKGKARRGAFRIPEATLFLFAIFGGSVGSLLGMHIFRHKTQKPAFYIGMPAILVFHILILLYFAFLSGFTFRIM